MIDYPRENRFLIPILEKPHNFMQISAHYIKQKHIVFSSRNLTTINH